MYVHAAEADMQPVELIEMTSSGIRQNWASVRSDPYRLPVVADTRGNVRVGACRVVPCFFPLMHKFINHLEDLH